MQYQHTLTHNHAPPERVTPPPPRTDGAVVTLNGLDRYELVLLILVNLTDGAVVTLSRLDRCQRKRALSG
jgi:hypothetical protein